MQVQQENKPYDDINVTPMLDLAYVLLVIFIIMTTASVQGIKVNLPKASNTPSLAKPKTKAVTINETVADIVGDEIADDVLAKSGDPTRIDAKPAPSAPTPR
ncbi:MAG: biopolymer transporter ExbD, partial [Burkholderiales bacterium]|nr:biopolymer transporter ExbD [Burkholderiales bacterium]